MIVIPMAGMSSRFFKAGYKLPKYMLEAHGKSLFEHSLRSFESYFKSELFLFIVKSSFDTPDFVRKQAKMMGIRFFHIVILDKDTRGQAETVALGLEQLDSTGVKFREAITIFNIDTFRPGFLLPKVSENCDGYLEVFRGSGVNWSFAKPKSKDTTLVEKTTEKNPISDLCSTGLYYFNKKQDYLDAYNNYKSMPEENWEKGELYIAPLYNYMISKGQSIHYHEVDQNDVIFCGTPEEYMEFLRLK